MSAGLAAGAFLALWNGHAPALDRGVYETWHTFEHVPERLSVPGMCWAERYAVDPGVACAQPYFTWYGMADLAVLDHPAYQDLLDHPTPWSAHVRPHLTAFHRRPCAAVGRMGVGRGGCLLTLECGGVAGAGAHGLPGLVADAMARAGVVSADWGCWAPGLGHPLDPPGSVTEGGWVVVLTHTHPAPLMATAQHLSKVWEPQGVRVRLSPVYHLQSVAHAPDRPVVGRPEPLTALWEGLVSGSGTGSRSGAGG